tara:strand:+ start:865 stop:1020 length:156 start_codon:yes stop_codon:yes gene_type:complete
MGALFGGILKSFMTEKVLKAIMITLGDYLVKSSKNKLDDVLWAKVKGVLQK